MRRHCSTCAVSLLIAPFDTGRRFGCSGNLFRLVRASFSLPSAARSDATHWPFSCTVRVSQAKRPSEPIRCIQRQTRGRALTVGNPQMRSRPFFPAFLARLQFCAEAFEPTEQSQSRLRQNRRLCCLNFHGVDVRHATSSAFKDINVGQVAKSRYPSEPHDLTAGWAMRPCWRAFIREFVGHDRKRPRTAMWYEADQRQRSRINAVTAN